MSKTNSFPTNALSGVKEGIFIEKATVMDLQLVDEDLQQSHRDNFHLFNIQETGNTCLEIDFQKHYLGPMSVYYIHPDQVHRVLEVEKATFTGVGIISENLHPEYLKLLEEIAPAYPLSLDAETFSVIHEAVSLCSKLAERKHEKLFQSLLNDSCNALVGLIISQYLAVSKSTGKASRAEDVTKRFKGLLERHFITLKKPAAYAEQLHISTAYLNECVKSTTGFPVSYHIQQRIILEAKRLLHYSDKSIKEVASALGYDDYPYFSRLFTKTTGKSPSSFRIKNHD